MRMAVRNGQMIRASGASDAQMNARRRRGGPLRAGACA
jgi:hypothetical protein